MSTKQDTTYNGYTNYETWNVALWIANDRLFYDLAGESSNYAQFLNHLDALDIVQTPDKVSFTDGDLNIDELNNLFWDKTLD